MSFINPRDKEINCKIIYYGPTGSGKSTLLHDIYKKTSSKDRGKMLTLSEGEDHTLFFDFLPLSLGTVKGYKIRFHLYSVPGHVVYDSSRKLILKGIDGLIFVVDSRLERLEDNIESWKALKENLRNNDIDFRTLPIALQFNKRDLGSAMPVSELQPLFNGRDLPFFESVAKEGKNVMECFHAVAKMVLKELK